MEKGAVEVVERRCEKQRQGAINNPTTHKETNDSSSIRALKIKKKIETLKSKPHR